jgi:DNA-binding ferritin-like protein
MENLLALLLQARNVAHVHHWKTKSFAQHMALGELYELLSEMADSLAEMAIGAHGDFGAVPHDEPTGWDKNSPLSFIQQLSKNLEALKTTIPQEEWYINKYEELQAAVAQIKYKLENLR